MINGQKLVYAIIRKKTSFKENSVIESVQDIIKQNGKNIDFISIRDLSAVVSNTQVSHFDNLDPKQITLEIAEFEKVNSSLIQTCDVIPMRFGLICESDDQIIDLLQKTYLQFEMALARVAGKAEYIVELFWEEQKIINKIFQENNEIQQLQKEIALKGSITSLPLKMKLGKHIFEEIEKSRKEIVDDIISELEKDFPLLKAGKLLDKKAKESDNGNEKQTMIMNYSILINKTEEQILESRLNQLAVKYMDGFKFRYIGPLPPYSFCDINFSQGNFDLVDTARKTLGLGETASFKQVKDAYRTLATQYHPDKHENNPNLEMLKEATETMKELVDAKRILTTYCKHYLMSTFNPQDTFAQESELCSFRKDDVENSIIVVTG